MKSNRRKFIKSVGTLSVGASILPPIKSLAETSIESDVDKISKNSSGEKFTIQILQTTDVHCQAHPHDELFWENDKAVFRKAGGYAHLATYVKNEREKNPNTFLIDTGDMFQGSELSVKTVGKAFVPILNALNYDLYLPGNWEVVYGKKNMQTLLGSLNAPKVCANMFHDLGEGKKGESIFPPYYIWNIKGVKIGFLGYTDPYVPTRQPPNYSKGIMYTHPIENMAFYVDVLRNQEQCAYVIILSHLGLSQQIYLSNHDDCKGVDYILGGDTHERVRKPIEGKHAKIVEPGAFGSFVGKLDLTIQRGKVIKDKYELIEIQSDRLIPSPEIASLIKFHETPFKNDINRVAGYSTIPLFRNFVIENTIDTLILDAIKWKLKSVDIVLSNGFRFCPPRSTPDHSGNIPITNGFIYDMLPVNNALRIGEVSGITLRDWVEKELNNVFAEDASQRSGGWLVKFKGMKIEFNVYSEMGSRVKKIIVNDENIIPEKMYKIAACERDGDPLDTLCRIHKVENPRDLSDTLHAVMKEYLAANSPVTPVAAESAIALDAPQTLLTQVFGVDYQFR